jgi:hypothetical protein
MHYKHALQLRTMPAEYATALRDRSTPVWYFPNLLRTMYLILLLIDVYVFPASRKRVPVSYRYELPYSIKEKIEAKD